MRPRYFSVFDRVPKTVRDVINQSPLHITLAEAFDVAGVDVVRWMKDNGYDLFDEVFEL